jgi:hypothetical protein
MSEKSLPIATLRKRKMDMKKMLFIFVCCVGMGLYATQARAGDQCSTPTVGTGTGAVGYATGTSTCGILITVTSVDDAGNATSYSVSPADPAHGNNGNPYDNSEDSLVGVQNSSAGNLRFLHLTTPSGAPEKIFGFDNDGPCRTTNHSPQYSWCSTVGFSGYEGPVNTFDVDLGTGGASGTVTFTTVIPPGGSTWFALEGSPESLTSTQTGPTIDSANSSTLTHTYTFSAVTNNVVEYIYDYTNAASTFTGYGNNAVPLVTNLEITPLTWPTIVAGTPFATTACIPVGGAGGNCMEEVQVCTISGGPAAGSNCPQSTERNIILSANFDPVDPVTTPGTIFGFVELSDSGACPFSPANPSCPQNGLVSFTGPGLNSITRGASSTNSSYVPVTGVLAPSTTVSGFVNADGWAKGTGGVTGTLTAVPPTNPGTNGNILAPIDSITYGVNPAAQGLPPTFLPIATDTTKFSRNPWATPGSATTTTSSCPTSITGSTSVGSFSSSVNLDPLAEGTYLMHYFSRDCAGTNELNFTLDGSNSWSTSFKALTIKVDNTPPSITVTSPAPTTYAANQVVNANYGCTDSGSGVASCSGTVASGSKIDTIPNGVSTLKTFTVNSADKVNNISSPTLVSYTISCHYASVTVSPSSVTRPALVTITASIADCVSASQKVNVKFTLTGPLGKNCSTSSTVMFTSPAFTIKSGTSNSVSFQLPILAKACTGTYTITTTTLKSGVTLDSVSSSLLVH